MQQDDTSSLLSSPRTLKCRGGCGFEGNAEETAQHEARCADFNPFAFSIVTKPTVDTREFMENLIARAERVIPGSNYIIGLSEDEFNTLRRIVRGGRED